MPRLSAQEVEDLEAFGARLRAARLRKGMTQRELAFDGCTPAYLSRMESGDRAPSLEVVRRLAERLDVSEEYLIGIEADASPSPSLDLLDAEVAMRLNDVDEAAKGFAELAAVDPSTRGVRLSEAGLGRVALARRDVHQAVQLLERAVRDWPRDEGDVPTQVAEALGRAYVGADMDDRARELIAELRPSFSTLSLRVLEGVLSGRAGDVETAASQLHDAVADARRLTVLRERAEAEWKNARELRSQHHFRDAEVHFHRALALADVMDDTRSVARALEELVALGVVDDGVRETLGAAAAALETYGDHRPALELRASEAAAALAAGERQRAKSLIAELRPRLADEASPSGRAWLQAGEVFAGLGETSDAIDAYQAAVKLLDARTDPDDLVKAYRRLADLLKRAGRTDEAFALLEEALALTGNAGGQAAVPAGKTS